jgi:hypothetical protein
MGRFSGLLLMSALGLFLVQDAIAIPTISVVDEVTCAVEPAVATPAVAAEADLSEQVRLLLQAAQTSARQGESAAALAQLEQAAELAKTLPLSDRRDYLLSPIGMAMVELEAFDRAEVIASSMTYETLGTNDLLRVDLEKALVRSYIQTEQLPQATRLIEAFKPEMRDQFWVLAVETLAQQGDISAAVDLFANVVDQGYFRMVGVNAINRVYLGAEQFEAAQAFLSQQPFTDPLDQGAGLNEVALWAARANRLDMAAAIAQQIPPTQRASLLVELAKLYQASNQDEGAIALLSEAEKLPNLTDNLYGDLETFSKIAALYISLDQPATARQVLEQAMQRDVSATPLPVVEWIGAFAKIGAFDRATQLMSSLPASERHEAHFRLATAYTDRGQYEAAITLLSPIPDGVLFPLPEYPDPKLELLNRIIDEATQQNQFAVAERAVQVMQAPVDQVRGWRKIAAAAQQPNQVIATLDRALAVAKTIDKYSFHVDRHSYYEVSNAELLIAIAEGYWAAGESEKAIATAQLGLQSLQNFNSEFASPWYTLSSLEKVGELARQWQQLDLRAATIAEMKKQIATQEAVSSPLLLDNLSRLVKMTYEPGATLSPESADGLARIEALRARAESPEQELAILNSLIYLYNFTSQSDRAQTAFNQALGLIEPLSADQRDAHYLQLVIASNQPPDRVAQLLPLLSSPQKQTDALLQMAGQYAADNQQDKAIESFEQAAQIAGSLSEGDRESAMISLANAYSYFNVSPSDSTPPRTSAEIALMRQIPQYISNPLLRARIWMNFVPYLPPTAAEAAYAALSSSLAEIQDDYARRNLLWQGIAEALSYQKNEQAAQLANALDGDYRQLALGFVEKQP